MNHRERHPTFRNPPAARGWKPSDEPLSLNQILLGLICWLVVIAAATGFMLPLITAAVRWVLRGD